MLISANEINYDLSNNKFVTGMDITSHGSDLTLHIACLSGEENLLFNSLPKFIHDKFKVTESVDQILIEAK